MHPRTVLRGLLRAARWYVALDLMIGPLLVLLGFLAWALPVLLYTLADAGWVSPPLAIAGVAAGWLGIFKIGLWGLVRAVRWAQA